MPELSGTGAVPIRPASFTLGRVAGLCTAVRSRAVAGGTGVRYSPRWRRRGLMSHPMLSSRTEMRSMILA